MWEPIHFLNKMVDEVSIIENIVTFLNTRPTYLSFFEIDQYFLIFCIHFLPLFLSYPVHVLKIGLHKDLENMKLNNSASCMSIGARGYSCQIFLGNIDYKFSTFLPAFAGTSINHSFVLSLARLNPHLGFQVCNKYLQHKKLFVIILVCNK